MCFVQHTPFSNSNIWNSVFQQLQIFGHTLLSLSFHEHGNGVNAKFDCLSLLLIFPYARQVNEQFDHTGVIILSKQMHW
jgi:hypothetical protein